MVNRKSRPQVAPTSAAFFAVLGLVMGFQGLSGQTADQDGLRARFEAMNEAFDSGDAGAVADFYAEGFVRLPPGEAAVLTHDDLRAGFEEFQAANEYSLDEFLIRRVEVSGDLGYTTATYTESLTPKAGGATETSSGRWAVMWKREDGSWKVNVEIWNLSPPD